VSFFVLLRNPSNGERLPLVHPDDPDVMATFKYIMEAVTAAEATLLGGNGYYEIYSTDEQCA
jgi:hypothetical protein